MPALACPGRVVAWPLQRSPHDLCCHAGLAPPLCQRQAQPACGQPRSKLGTAPMPSSAAAIMRGSGPWPDSSEQLSIVSQILGGQRHRQRQRRLEEGSANNATPQAQDTERWTGPAPDQPMCNRLKQAMVRDQEDEEEKVQWRVDAEVRLRTGALQAEAAQAAAQQGSQHSHLQARLCSCYWSLRWGADSVASERMR